MKLLSKLKVFAAVVFVSLLYTGILNILLGGVYPMPVFNASKAGVRLPVIMYHSVLKDTALSGKYVITPDELVSDINYLKDNGYTFVSAQEVIDYAAHNAPLPAKPVMLTFDDGFYNSYGYVLPILEETGAKAIISVVGSYTDEYSESNIKNLTYGYMRWSEVYDLFLSNRTEVGNHSYDFHSNTGGRNGSKRKAGESLSEYERVFCKDTEKAQNRFITKTGFTPVVYTYPFGAYSDETTQFLKDMGFKMSLSCSEGINTITDPDSLFLLKRTNRPGGISSKEFFRKLLSEE